ncbi:MAG: DUF2269 domain-containing protein [Pseudomonadota bacterium]|nr:DUF2269 domain-containing protein [Pseudomonadota bacterium]
MSSYLLLKFVHLLSAMAILGTGAGTAFAMFMGYRSRDVAALRVICRNVILADWWFTTPAVLVQPATGLLLMWQLGYSWRSGWFAAVAALYLVAGACWIPVVVIQYRLHRFVSAPPAQEALPVEFHHLMKLWVALGIPAFSAVMLLLVLMIWKPWL